MYLQETSGTYTAIKTAKAEGKTLAFYGIIDVMENANAFRTASLIWDSSSGNSSITKAIQNQIKLAWVDGIFSKISMPKKWLAEGAEAPTENAINIGKRIALNMWSKFNLKPYDVQASIEGGIMLNYRKNQKYAVIEVDNEEDVNCVAGIGKQISFSKSLEESNLNAVGAFFENANP